MLLYFLVLRNTLILAFHLRYHWIMIKLTTFLFAVLLSSTSTFSQAKYQINKNDTLSILFVGNSLTYENDLPQLVKENARKKGYQVNIGMIALPNYAIVDHWKDGEVQELITSKKYDFVIIQQGPSSQNDGRQMLIENGKDYAHLCETNDIRLCYFMVWPSIKYYHTFNGVIKNYKDAAAINNAILLPVGEVWKEYIDRTNSYDYYGSDGFHPSLKGSQKAAEIIVEYLFR